MTLQEFWTKCTPGQVFALAGVTDSSTIQIEQERVQALLEQEPVFLWGDDFEKHIRKNPRQAASHVVHSVAVKSDLIEKDAHRVVVETALANSTLFVGTYADHVATWLDRNWGKLIALGSLAGALIMKGEFGHYEQVRDHLFRAHDAGVSLRILKGNDERAHWIKHDLESHGIPTRLHDAMIPKIRAYLFGDNYLYFVSLPGREFWGFFGDASETATRVRHLLEQRWEEYKPVA